MNKFRFKNQFRHIIYYSMPDSILYILRKRLNLLSLLIFVILIILFSFL